MRRTNQITLCFLLLLLNAVVSCGQKKDASVSYSKFYVAAEAIDTMISAMGYIRMNQGAYLRADLNIKGNVSKITFYETKTGSGPVTSYNKEDQINMVTFHNGLIASFSDYKGLLYEFLYDSNDRLVQRIHHYRDVMNNSKVELIYTDFSYDRFGNLLSQFQWKIPERGGTSTYEFYKKYHYYYDNDTLVVKCLGIDDFYRRMGQDSRFVIEYRFANGRILSETGKKKAYKKNYTYNKDSVFIRYEGSFGDGKQYHIYERDIQNRLIRYVDSFVYAGSQKRLRADQRVRYDGNISEISYYDYPDDKEHSGKGKLTLTRKTTFGNERIIEDHHEFYFTRHNYTDDSNGNWIVMQAEELWKEDNGKYKSSDKTFTHREIQYTNSKPIIRQPVHDPAAERLKEDILITHKDFLNNEKKEY